MDSDEKDELIQNKPKNLILNIKSPKVLSQLLDIVPMKKKLKFVKYNKGIREKIKIKIEDYKDYSSIIIEIKPVKGKEGIFINIVEEEQNYYHIYFNNNTIEVDTNYLEEDSDVDIIKIIIDYQVKSFYKLFDEIDCIESINFKTFFRTNINNMSYMFSKCTSLKKINLSSFNTDNVTDMSYMFYGCTHLEEINFSNFNTDKVTDISFMYSGCNALKEATLFSYNDVFQKDKILEKCSSLEVVKIHNFNINDIYGILNIFIDCKSLREIHIYNEDTNHVVDVSHLFQDKVDEKNE